MSNAYVSLDLETTGVDPVGDEIIEIAAVKFQGQRVVDIFHKLVNPCRPLSYYIRFLTGITQAEVDAAPFFSQVADELVSFIGSCPIVGQRVGFDLAFLSRKGIDFASPVYDTFELASILLPHFSDYSLSSLAREFMVSFPEAHRALPHAMATKEVFLRLLDKAEALPLPIIVEINRLTAETRWSLRPLFLDIEKKKLRTMGGGGGQLDEIARGELLIELFPERPECGEPLIPNYEKQAIDVGMLVAMLERGGLMEKAFPRFEHRPEQVRMMRAVAEALNHSEHLIVEAGAGTGKTIAYLLPSILFALKNSAHVVISTNTISLQEQLVHKDIPDLLRALEMGQSTRFVQVKGRSNYLCLRRWDLLRRSQGLSLDEVKLLIRTLLWLRSTTTGDRAELNLAGGEALAWNKVCAQADNCLAGECVYQRRGDCFLHRARSGGEGAHLIIVNHALLLSDMLSNNAVLPDYRYLIIDEAHHLEGEATEQLGFHIAEYDLYGYLSRLTEMVGGGQYKGFLMEIEDSVRSSLVGPSRRREIRRITWSLQERVKNAHERVFQFFDSVSHFLECYAEESGEYERRLRITSGIRVDPGWAAVRLAWDNLSLVLMDIDLGLSQLYSALESLSEAKIRDYENLMVELSSLMYRNSELRSQVNSIISHPESGNIYWASLGAAHNVVTLCAAPLSVGEKLAASLFSKKDCVVLTSATLSTETSFEYIKGRLGLKNVRELMLGTPFDYTTSTMIYITEDVPEPDRPGYRQAVERAIIELCRVSGGRALVLFTSHAALGAIYAAIRDTLEREGVLVLGQGIDGSPKQLLTTFKAAERCVLLGTSSLWEGIDVVGEALSILVITRLPFPVPTDPVFAARAELFDDAFNQYTVPQAILRFKQGFGRLIRSKTDRGVVVVLDRRIQTKSYGAAFLQSLPPCVVRRGPTCSMPAEVVSWLGGARSFPQATGEL